MKKVTNPVLLRELARAKQMIGSKSPFAPITPESQSRVTVLLKVLISAVVLASKEMKKQLAAMDKANNLPYLPIYTTFEKGWCFIEPDPLRYGVRVVTGLGGFEYIEPNPQPRQDPEQPKYPPITTTKE